MRLSTNREKKYVLQLDKLAINIIADGVWLHWMRIGDRAQDSVSYRAFNFIEHEAPSLRGHALVIREHESYWTGRCTRCREWSCTQISEDAVIQAFAGHLYSPKCAVCHTRKEDKMGIVYKVTFQLGGISRVNHHTIAAAVKELHEIKARARKSGDSQALDIVAIEDGCERPLTDAEFAIAFNPANLRVATEELDFDGVQWEPFHDEDGFADGYFALVDGVLYVIPMDENGLQAASDPIEVDFSLDIDYPENAARCRKVEAELKRRAELKK